MFFEIIQQILTYVNNFGQDSCMKQENIFPIHAESDEKWGGERGSAQSGEALPKYFKPSNKPSK